MLIHGLPQTAPRDVRIDLRGGNVGVPQHDLDTAQIRAAFHQMSGETVPHDVRRQAAKNSRRFPISAQQLPEPLASHRPAPRGHEQKPAGATLQQPGTPLRQVFPHRFARRHSERHQALLITFPRDPQDTRVSFHITNLQLA